MQASSLGPIEHNPLYEVVAARLRDFIDVEGLEPGDRLPPERELAERLGVSRTSVRQALTALRVTGLLDIRQGAGTYLKRSPADLVSSLAAAVAEAETDHPMIWEVREAIEVQAARLAATRRTRADLDDMSHALTMMAQSVDAGGDGLDGDRLFHRAVVRAAHNPLLTQLVDELADAIDRTSEVSLTLPNRPALSLAAHRRILSRIQAEESDEAADAMRRHISDSAESVVSTPT